ncbi:MAG: beta-lactamase family protein [Myxococcales bacterium]|nr:beta-lactamase family protein [Myxococcales bacterium]
MLCLFGHVLGAALLIADHAEAHEPAAARPAAAPSAEAAEDPRIACVAAHADAPLRHRGVIRALCGEAASLGVVGASLAIAEGGAAPRVVTWGRARAGGPRIAPETAFRIGSLTKVMTAALALALVDDGVLELDAPLARVLPELAEGVDDRLAAVTLRQLLTHSAGLAELGPGAASAGREGWLRALGERELIADPGAIWSYANVGYAVIGAAIERATGEPWGALLRRRLLAPLGLDRISVDPKMSVETGASHGHLGRGEGAFALDVADDFALGAGGATWTLPAGGVIASAPDLAAFALALVDPARSPLSAAAIELLTTPTLPTHERPGEGQAAGLRVRALPGGGALLLASGDTGDFAADLLLVPERGVAVVVLANAGVHLRATLAAALHDLLGVGPEAPAPMAAPARYVGDYVIGDLELGVAVRAEGGELTITAPLVAAAPLVLEHLGDHRFRVRGRSELGAMTFVFMADGEPASFLRGRWFLAVRRG